MDNKAPGVVPLRLFKKPAAAKIAENSSRYCIVHYEYCKDVDVKPLSERAYQSIKSASEIRLQSRNPLHNLIDISSSVPSEYNSEKYGIHTFCYKSYTNTSNVKAALSNCDKVLSTNLHTKVENDHRHHLQQVSFNRTHVYFVTKVLQQSAVCLLV